MTTDKIYPPHALARRSPPPASALPLLAACGGGGPATAARRAPAGRPAGSGRRSGDGSRRPRTSRSAAATIFADQKVVVTQPTAGRVQVLHRHLHPPGLPGRPASPTAPSTATATAAVLDRGRRRRAAARRTFAARRGPDHRHGRRDHPRPEPARATRQGGMRRASAGRAASAAGPAGRRAARAPRRSRSARTSAAIRVSSMISRWASEPPSRRTAAGQRGERVGGRGEQSPAASRPQGAGPAERRPRAGSGGRARRPSRASRPRPGRSSSASSVDRGVHARGTASRGARGASRPASAATRSRPGTSAASGVSAQRNSSEPVSTSARQPSAVLGPQLGVVPPADGVEVAEGQLVQRRVPGEVAEAVDRARRRR